AALAVAVVAAHLERHVLTAARGLEPQACGTLATAHRSGIAGHLQPRLDAVAAPLHVHLADGDVDLEPVSALDVEGLRLGAHDLVAAAEGGRGEAGEEQQ